MILVTSIQEMTTNDRLAAAIRECYEGVGDRRDGTAIRQVDVAERVGLLQGQLSKYVSGSVRPPLEMINAIEAACGRPKGWILIRAGYVDLPRTVPEVVLTDVDLSHASAVALLTLYRGLVAGGEAV